MTSSEFYQFLRKVEILLPFPPKQRWVITISFFNTECVDRNLQKVVKLVILETFLKFHILDDDGNVNKQYYRLTNWLMFLCGQIQSPRPDVMPDRREGIARAEGFVAARIETSVS